MLGYYLNFQASAPTQDYGFIDRSPPPPQDESSDSAMTPEMSSTLPASNGYDFGGGASTTRNGKSSTTENGNFMENGGEMTNGFGNYDVMGAEFGSANRPINALESATDGGGIEGEVLVDIEDGDEDYVGDLPVEFGRDSGFRGEGIYWKISYRLAFF